MGEPCDCFSCQLKALVEKETERLAALASTDPVKAVIHYSAGRNAIINACRAFGYHVIVAEQQETSDGQVVN